MIILISKKKQRVRVQKFIEILEDNKIDYQLVYQSKDYKNKLLSYINWTGVVIKYFIKNKKASHKEQSFHIIGFEVALICWLLRMGIHNKIIFDNTDNFSESKNFKFGLKKVVRLIENIIIKKVTIHIVPDPVRLDTYKYKLNAVILNNTPTRKSIETAKELKSIYPKRKKFRIYVNGWLPETRGRRLIFDFIKSNKDNDIEFLIATYETYSEDLPNTYQVGRISNTQSLAEYLSADLVFTLYDPTIPINKIATPNKWNDAILTKTIPILNREIQTVKNYFPYGGFISIQYDNSKELSNEIQKFITDSAYREMLRREIAKNPVTYFDEKYLQILFHSNII